MEGSSNARGESRADEWYLKDHVADVDEFGR
jgi:hypothetical protein